MIYSRRMARPLRIAYEGCIITSRGDRREVLDNVDRWAFIEVLAQALKRFDARAWAYLLDGRSLLAKPTSRA